jgi:hypothetical protein
MPWSPARHSRLAWGGRSPGAVSRSSEMSAVLQGRGDKSQPCSQVSVLLRTSWMAEGPSERHSSTP